MDIILRLMLAHILGDFFFQSEKCCKEKKQRTLKGICYSALHALIMAILAYVIIGDWYCWLIPVIILTSHFLIDLCKSWYQKDAIYSFVIDQAAHIFIIIAIGYIYADGHISWEIGSRSNFLLYGLSYLIILKPTSILTKLFINQWAPSGGSMGTLPNAGKWIGYLERILTLTFIYANHVEGIGFLLAAKSIFRFGDLNKAKDVRTTEYVLLGTFMSFAISILIGFAVKGIIG